MVVNSYLRWVRFERPACLFIDIEADGSREMMHAWEIIDTEFKKYQDREIKKGSGGKGGNDWEEDGDPETGSHVAGGGGRVHTDANGFPILKGNYHSVG